ncbi:MAG: DedA family protein [Candidatus Omnitrophica bacterium]|nr:DedA family protein [Candidatus Omnitrophota bacterium]
MVDVAVQGGMTKLITELGDLGVFIAMFLESSVVPIPSEVIVIGAGAIGIPIPSIVIFGSIGATLGAAVGYLLGKYAAMPVILKFGKYVLIKPHHIYKAEAFAKKYGMWSVLIGRVIPVVPFKVFSIASGLTNIPFVPFLICTLIGVVPRIYLLSIFGYAVIKFTKPVLLVVISILLIFLAVKITRNIYNGRKKKGRV